MNLVTLCISLILSLTLLNPSTIAADKSTSAISNIVVFGDSLSDSGNNKNLTTSAPPDITKAPITNIDPDEAAKSTWITYLIKQLNPNATIINWKTFSTGSLPERMLTNVNLSWASAETGKGYIDDHSSPAQPNQDCKEPGLDPIHPTKNCVPNVQTQIHLYFNRLNAPPNQNTLFIIFAGSNDILNELYRLGHTPTPADINRIITNSITNLGKAVTELEGQGVSEKNIVVFNLPDLSKGSDVATNPALQQLTGIIVPAYNNKLSKVISELGVIIYDDSSWMSGVLQSDNSREANHFRPKGIPGSNCISGRYGNPKIGTFYQGYFISNCASNTPDPNPSGSAKYLNYFFVNGKHPTTYAQKQLSFDICKHLSSHYNGFDCKQD